MSDFTMFRGIVEVVGDTTVLAVDTIAHVRPEEDAGRVVMTGSHGGVSSGEYAARAPLAAVFFNDAGIGKDEAGVAGLGLLSKLGIAAGAVSHESAEIGLGRETWGGVISALNPQAEAAGFKRGEPVRAAVHRIFGKGEA
ncbi:hypothetical protein [Pikeienuella sp. HZG-20]|uniref:hypothetical protein n=1 Tax=Paludibacillus litoralis TaxID=3133267 RepID=UPI0030EBA5F4